MQSLLSSQGFGVVNGHSARGIGERFHQLPTVRRGAAPRTHLTPFNFFLKPGCFFALEPVANEGTARTVVSRDGWTVVTADGRRSAQVEHTVGVGDAGCEARYLRRYSLRRKPTTRGERSTETCP